ncbi:MAG: type II toxin-antitoxin system RelE/ParE family toxin [Rhodospirillales bacterium]
MTERARALVVGDAARRDLKAIARYTERRWGAAQRRRYMDGIRDCLARLRRDPELGVPRDDVGPDYRSLNAGRHVVFYRDAADAIVVVRVLHQRMDVRRLPPSGS